MQRGEWTAFACVALRWTESLRLPPRRPLPQPRADAESFEAVAHATRNYGNIKYLTGDAPRAIELLQESEKYYEKTIAELLRGVEVAEERVKSTVYHHANALSLLGDCLELQGGSADEAWDAYHGSERMLIELQGADDRTPTAEFLKAVNEDLADTRKKMVVLRLVAVDDADADEGPALEEAQRMVKLAVDVLKQDSANEGLIHEMEDVLVEYGCASPKVSEAVAVDEDPTPPPHPSRPQQPGNEPRPSKATHRTSRTPSSSFASLVPVPVPVPVPPALVQAPESRAEGATGAGGGLKKGVVVAATAPRGFARVETQTARRQPVAKGRHALRRRLGLQAGLAPAHEAAVLGGRLGGGVTGLRRNRGEWGGNGGVAAGGAEARPAPVDQPRERTSERNSWQLGPCRDDVPLSALSVGRPGYQLPSYHQAALESGSSGRDVVELPRGDLQNALRCALSQLSANF